MRPFCSALCTELPYSHLHTGIGERLAGASRCAGRSQTRIQARNLPRSGYFADADPHAEVYPALGGVEQADYTERGGRYTSDFIWNTKWKDQLDLEISQKEARKKAAEEPEAPVAGGLSFSRLADLNSMEVDLSGQLLVRKAQPASKQQPTAPSRPGTSAAASVALQRKILYEKGRQKAGFENMAPTQGESRRWERSGRFSKKVVTAVSTNPAEVEAQATRAEQERLDYEALKQSTFRWTLATTAACFAATYAFYSRDTAASYGVGAVGGLMYLRLLNRSVDGMAGGGFVGAAGGQARLLIPVILALAYNRWHVVGAFERTGVELEPLPMLLGFFTYKAGVVSKQFVDLVGAASRGLQKDAAVTGNEAEDVLMEK